MHHCGPRSNTTPPPTQRFKTLVNKAVEDWGKCKEKHETRIKTDPLYADAQLNQATSNDYYYADVVRAELWAACSTAGTNNGWVYKSMLDLQLAHWKFHFRDRKTQLCVVTGDMLRGDLEGCALRKIASFFKLEAGGSGSVECGGPAPALVQKTPWYISGGGGGDHAVKHHHRKHLTTMSSKLHSKLVAFYGAHNETFRSATANRGWFGHCFNAPESLKTRKRTQGV